MVPRTRQSTVCLQKVCICAKHEEKKENNRSLLSTGDNVPFLKVMRRTRRLTKKDPSTWRIHSHDPETLYP